MSPPFTSSSIVRPPMANQGGSGPAAPGSIPASALEDGVVKDSVRLGALFEGDVVATVNYGPSANAVTYEVSLVLTASSQGVLIGRSVSGYARLRLRPGGILWVENGTSLIAAATVALPLGFVTPRVEIEATVARIYVAGKLIETLTYAAQTWASGAQSTSIGGQSAGVVQYSGQLWNVRLIDPADDTNTAYFPLDGDFTNQHPGSTVADATVTGFVGFAEVLGVGGEPVRVGRMVYLHLGSVTGMVIDGSVNASPYITLDAIEYDETGGMATGDLEFFVAPTDGVVSIQAAVKVPANADPADPALIRVQRGTTVIMDPAIELGTRSEATDQVMSMFTVSSGDNVRLRFSGVASTTTTTADIGVQLRFYPADPA